MMKKQSPLTKASDPVMDAANGKHAPRERLTKYRKLWILISAGLLALAVALVGMILALKSRPPPLYAGVSSMPAAESELIADQTAEEPSLESAPAATPDESVPLSEPQASSAAPISSASSTQSVQASSLPPAVSSKGPALPSFPLPDSEPLVTTPVDALGDIAVLADRSLSDFFSYADGWIYTRDPDLGSSIIRMRPDGSDRQTLCAYTSYVTPVVDQGYLYYVLSKYIGEQQWTPCGIKVLNPNDLSQTSIPTPADVNALWVHDGWILYRCDAKKNSPEGPLYAMRTDGSGCVRIADRCNYVVFNDSWVFIGEREEDSSRLRMTCYRFQDNTKQILNLDGLAVMPRLIDSEYVYFIIAYQTDIVFNKHAQPNSCLYRLRLDNFTMEKIAEYEGVNYIYNLKAQDGWIYFEREIGPNYYHPTYTLYRVRPDGTENTYLCQCDLMQQCRIDGNLLYYTTFEDNRMVFRCLSLDGERYQTLYRCDGNSRIADFFIADGKPTLLIYTW